MLRRTREALFSDWGTTQKAELTGRRPKADKRIACPSLDGKLPKIRMIFSYMLHHVAPIRPYSFARVGTGRSPPGHPRRAADETGAAHLFLRCINTVLPAA